MSRRYQLVYTDGPHGNALQVVDNGRHTLRFTDLVSCQAAFMMWGTLTDDKVADAFVDGLHAMYMLTLESFGAIKAERVERTH